jgi:hypothetical protein
MEPAIGHRGKLGATAKLDEAEPQAWPADVLKRLVAGPTRRAIERLVAATNA